jgi:microsomal epoxide hydrolase
VHEAALNAYPQFKVKLHDIDVHYLHVPWQGPSPMPLLLMHGWPRSVFEFIDIIPRLTDPARFGGDPADAFTVIAPSLPGFGLSFTPGQKRFNVAAIAACLSDLMTEVLGYRRYAAQGGDIGAGVGARLSYAHPQDLIGIHVNMLIVPPDRQPPPSPTEEERRYYEEQATWLREETGYQWIQGTKPQTLAYALTDSPAGLAAWIAEKFRNWSDYRRNGRARFRTMTLKPNEFIRRFLVHHGPASETLHLSGPSPRHRGSAGSDGNRNCRERRRAVLSAFLRDEPRRSRSELLV